MDTIQDQPQGVLGFHTEDQGGKLWGVVAAKPELDNGAQVTTGDWSVSSVLSHEVLEMFVDPNCNLWANDGKGSAYSFEVCDPVEAPSYAVNGVSVSNFVTPSWFDPLAARHRPVRQARPPPRRRSASSRAATWCTNPRARSSRSSATSSPNGART